MDKTTLIMINSQLIMNLYVFNESSRAAVYGIGTYIRELTESLRDSDINICVVHLKTVKPAEEADERGNIRHWYIPAPISRNSTSDRIIQHELYYRNVVFLLRVQITNTDRLVFHLNNNRNSTLAEELKKKFDCKIVTVVHYADWGVILYDNLPRLRAILQEKHPDDLGKNVQKTIEKEKSLYSLSDRVICLSNYMHDILCRDYKLNESKIVVIPNGLTDSAKTMPDKKPLRKKWKIPVKEKVILFAGRIDEAKGMSYLIKAFRKVLTVFPICRLVITGEGDFSKYTKEAQDICAKITYTGMLPKTLLYEWYSLSDVGVIPSLFEPFGFVTVEMMMHSLPIVATATSGLNEVVDDNCGLKITLKIRHDSVEIDTSSLAKKIVYLLQHPAEAMEMGLNGRKRYLNEYTSEVFRRNMQNFYHSLL